MPINHEPQEPKGMPSNQRAPKTNTQGPGAEQAQSNKRTQGRQPMNLDDEQQQDHRVVEDGDNIKKK